MQCRDFARQLAEASPLLAERNTRVLVIGPGSAHDAERLAKAVKLDPASVLYDENGTVYDQYALDRVLFSLIQQSAIFLIDQAGVLRYAYAVANPGKWLGGSAFQDMLKSLESLG